MERKMRTDMNVELVLGILFSFLGMIFVPIGICVGISLMKIEKEFVLFFIVFTGMGILFLVIGITLWVLQIKKQKMQRDIFEGGYYVYAQILEVNRNYNIEYGKKGHPYIIRCGYTDEMGTLHIFSSRNIYNYPGNDLIGQQVRVYLDRNDYNNYKNYYVDIDDILPNVVEHW